MKEPFVILTGLSGSGKSAAIRVFEDMGYYCVDNLPVALIPVFADLCSRGGEETSQVALVIDIRERSFLLDFPEMLGRLRGTHQVAVLFFEASDEVLSRRFGETRRPHPMATDTHGLSESIAQERRALQHIRQAADCIVDTTAFSVHELKAYILDNFLDADRRSSLLLTLQSFGFKYGVPRDLDLLFDVRFMSNPFFVESLKGMTGKDAEVIRFLEEKPEYEEFLARIEKLLRFLLPLYIREGKSYLRIGLGCTGGKHRSVAVTERLAARLAGEAIRLRVRHRDMERE
jgi:UPF0042 nucleotide-binding protein